MSSEPRRDITGRNLQVLVVGSDISLEDEFRSAVSGIPGTRAAVHFAQTYRHALETVRGRQPDFVVIEIDRALEEVAGLAKEIDELVPATAIAAAFRPDRLEQGHSESGMIIGLLRAQVRDFLRRPLSATELRAVLERLFSARHLVEAGTQGRLASFVSNKGGVGKSTLAVNVACGLATRYPDDVLLIDLSLQLGTCSLMLDLNPTTTILDAVKEKDRLDETLLRHLALRHATGLRLLAAPGNAIEAADVDDEAVGRILSMARRTFRHVVIDTFPVLDSVVMASLDLSDVAFVVVQGTAPSVAGAARFLPILDGLGFPATRRRLVLNYNYRNFLGNLRPGDIAQRLRLGLDYVVPYDRRVLVSMNTGSPRILHAARWQRFGRVIGQVVDDLANGSHSGTDPRTGPTEDRRWVHTMSERRRGFDRRVKDVGRLPGDRRSGLDRRTAPAGPVRVGRGVTL
jgi:pilus assembly protein CpaE